MTKIFVAAGEASGDLHAAELIRALRARQSGLQFFGLGGELSRQQGVELIYDLRSLAVTGFWEVAKRIFEFRRIFKNTLQKIREERPDLAILVDYPGMNLRLAKELKALNIPVVYYIVPQVWAWKPGRIRQIEERVDLLLSILPFEKELFDPARISCEYVGHPLLDAIPGKGSDGDFRLTNNVPGDSKIVALLPGSRLGEIERHYETMLKAVILLRDREHKITPFVAVRPEIDQHIYVEIEARANLTPQHITDDRYSLLRSADVSVVASGTATLETALCGNPFCIVYKTAWLTYHLAKRLINLKMVGLANIVSGELIVPEFLQNEMTPTNITNFCEQMLQSPEAGNTIRAKLKGLRNKLGTSGATDRAADLIVAGFLR